MESLEASIRSYTLPEFAYFLSQVHIAQGNYGAAVKDLTSLVSVKTGTPEYKLALASVYEHMGNQKEALRLYEETLRLSPANQEAKRKVMEYYSRPQ